MYSQTYYVHSSTVLLNELNSKISVNVTSNNETTTLTGSAAVKPEDLILFIFVYTAEDANKLYQRYNEFKSLHNITHSYVNFDYTRAMIFKAYLYSQNLHVLLLPPDTKYLFFAWFFPSFETSKNEQGWGECNDTFGNNATRRLCFIAMGTTFLYPFHRFGERGGK